ncbi:hypothetical protein, partial [Cronobacter malonaticus]|uniref:hypothetical protein n=1 Tax=Cronobacter malonaticus TaxID=413503 RepID=UPI001F45307A
NVQRGLAAAPFAIPAPGGNRPSGADFFSRSKTTHITVGLFWTAGALRLPALQKTPFSPHATHKKTPGKPGV